jgi:hypothetical protein
MSNAVFKLTVKEFKRYDKGDCPYEIAPPPGSKETTIVDTNGHVYPTWHCGKGVELHVGHYQKDFTLIPKKRIPTTIRLTSNHAVLRFEIVDAKGKSGIYYPIGMGFFRADETEPMGSPYTTGARRVPITMNGEVKESPFSKMRINVPPGTIEFDVERIAKLYSKGIKEHLSKKDFSKKKGTGTHRTYALIVCVQDMKTGQMGVFDSPELEPPV